MRIISFNIDGAHVPMQTMLLLTVRASSKNSVSDRMRTIVWLWECYAAIKFVAIENEIVNCC